MPKVITPFALMSSTAPACAAVTNPPVATIADVAAAATVRSLRRVHLPVVVFISFTLLF
jgi:hypothetical protein